MKENLNQNSQVICHRGYCLAVLADGGHQESPGLSQYFKPIFICLTLLSRLSEGPAVLMETRPPLYEAGLGVVSQCAVQLTWPWKIPWAPCLSHSLFSTLFQALCLCPPYLHEPMWSPGISAPHLMCVSASLLQSRLQQSQGKLSLTSLPSLWDNHTPTFRVCRICTPLF